MGITSAYNFASVTPALPPGDRQVYYGSFTRDLCDKYLTVFGDFKYARSYFRRGSWPQCHLRPIHSTFRELSLIL